MTPLEELEELALLAERNDRLRGEFSVRFADGEIRLALLLLGETRQCGMRSSAVG